MLDPEEFLAEGRSYQEERHSRNGHAPTGTASEPSKWRGLFEKQPEGGGPYNGRNNALTALVGFLRAKRFPYEAALDYALHWNEAYCTPPLPHYEVDERVGRAWHEWREGDLSDATPEDAKIKDDAQHGEPVTIAELLDIANDPTKQLKWIAQDLIQEDGVTIISGPSGHGKTWLSLDLCRHLTRDDDEETGQWLGLYSLPRKGVLYMDEENGHRTIAKRVQALGFHLSNSRFYDWSDSLLKLEVSQDRKRIIDFCKAKGLTVVVFDSLKAFHARDENSATEMRRVGEWLRAFVTAGLCVIVLHHDKKGNGIDGSDQDRTRGSGDITAFSQSVIGLVQEGEVFKVSKRKIRNAENDHRIVTYTLTHNEDGGLFLDTESGRELTEQQRAARAEAAFNRKLERVTKAIATIEASGGEVTTRTIGEVAKMSLRDVGDVQRRMREVSE